MFLSARHYRTVRRLHSVWRSLLNVRTGPVCPQLTEEKRAFDEEERKASEELIQKLLQEEEQQLQEEMKRRETDEKLARLLSNQLVSVLAILS